MKNLPTIPYSTPFLRNAVEENLLTFSYYTSFYGNTIKKICKLFYIPKYRYYKVFAKGGTLLGLKYTCQRLLNEVSCYATPF